MCFKSVISFVDMLGTYQIKKFSIFVGEDYNLYDTEKILIILQIFITSMFALCIAKVW